MACDDKYNFLIVKFYLQSVIIRDLTFKNKIQRAIKWLCMCAYVTFKRFVLVVISCIFAVASLFCGVLVSVGTVVHSQLGIQLHGRRSTESLREIR